MDAGPIIITARNADTKLINQLLLYLRNWEYSEDPYWDQHRILRTVKDANEKTTEAEAPPIHDFAGNQYEGMTLQAVEALMMQKNQSPFLVLDDQGVQEQTIILFERAINQVSADELYYDEYNKMRIPWQEVNPVFVNLSIGNMSFEDFTMEGDDEEDPEDPEPPRARGRWWTFKRIGDAFSTELAVRRDAAIRELAKLDLA